MNSFERYEKQIPAALVKDRAEYLMGLDLSECVVGLGCRPWFGFGWPRKKRKFVKR